MASKIAFPSIEAVAHSALSWRRQYPQIIEEEFIFFGPWGRLDMTYGQYLMCGELRTAWQNKDWYRLSAGRRIYMYPLSRLRKDKDLRTALNAIEREKRVNPLQFFLPSGASARAFLNDTKSSAKMIIAGNRFGKTTLGIIDMLLDILPCDPKWKIFTENGVNFRRHRSAQNWGCASYMWRHITSTVAPLILQWSPNHMLGAYAPNTGKKARTVNDKKPWIEYDASIGALVNFYVYEQPQENFESAAHNGWLWDEQGEEAKFDGADERTRTCHGRHIFPLTPHKVKGRVDTGAGTWLHRLCLGEYTKGHTVGVYTANTFDNPEWNYPEQDKVKAYNKWVTEPRKHHDRKKLAEGRSRLFAEWHIASGLIYDDLVESIHIIDEFAIPSNWTRYRGLDHGDVNPTACVFAAVDPNNDIYVYDEYYEAGENIYDNVKAIVEKSGNKLECVERRADIGGNVEFDIFEEAEYVSFEWTKLDARSFATTGDSMSGRKYGEIYRDAGLYVNRARGGDHTVRVPLVSEYLRVDYEKKHAITGELGAPKVYISRNCKMLIKELFSYRWNEQKETANGLTDAKPVKKNDHSVNALEYLLMGSPSFRGIYTQSDMNKWHDGVSIADILPVTINTPRNKITGY